MRVHKESGHRTTLSISESLTFFSFSHALVCLLPSQTSVSGQNLPPRASNLYLEIPHSQFRPLTCHRSLEFGVESFVVKSFQARFQCCLTCRPPVICIIVLLVPRGTKPRQRLLWSSLENFRASVIWNFSFCTFSDKLNSIWRSQHRKWVSLIEIFETGTNCRPYVPSGCRSKFVG